MANTADDYAAWIVKNQDKVGTPEFNTVAEAYKQAKAFEPKSDKPYQFDTPTVPALMNIGQGLSFGFGDEIAGALGADKDRYRATVDQFRKDYPMSSLLGTVSGSALLPIGGAKLAVESPALAAATVGAIGGALQGAGDAETLSSTPNEAARSAITGGVLGPAALMVGSTGGNVLAALGSKLPKLGGDVAEWIARRRIANAFERDSTTANDVGKTMVGLGSESRIADAAGENTRNLLDLNSNLPGKTANNLEELIRNRISTRPDRLDDVVYQVNGGYGRAGELSAALAEQKAKESAPLYAKAHALMVKPTTELVSILDAAKKLGAFGLANKSATANRQVMSLTGSEVEKLKQVGYDPITNQKTFAVTGGNPLSIKDLDLVKRGLDSLIERETDSVTGKVSSLGRDYIGLKNSLVSELDRLTIDPKTGESVYAAARQAFAGPSALETAIKKGRAVLNNDAEKIAAMTAGMSNGELEAFRVGAGEALRGQFGSQGGQTRFLNAWKDRNIREKLQALLGDDVKYSDVMNIINGEATLKRLESLGPSRNSRTFARQMANEDQNSGVVGDIASAGVSAKTGSLLGVMGPVSRLYQRGMAPEPVRDAIGSILMRQYAPAEIKALMDAQEALRTAKALSSGSAGLLGGKIDPLK